MMFTTMLAVDGLYAWYDIFFENKRALSIVYFVKIQLWKWQKLSLWLLWDEIHGWSESFILTPPHLLPTPNSRFDSF